MASAVLLMLDHVRGGESQRRFVDGEVAPRTPVIGVQATSHGGNSTREGVMASVVQGSVQDKYMSMHACMHAYFDNALNVDFSQ